MTVLIAYASRHSSTWGIAERLVVRIVKAPEGDFRPWEEIDAWADTIAAQLAGRRSAADLEVAKR